MLVVMTCSPDLDNHVYLGLPASNLMLGNKIKDSWRKDFVLLNST